MRMDSNGTSVHLGTTVPRGHVIVSEKWRGSVIVQRLLGTIKPIFEDGLDSLDFHLPNQTCVLYISETDVVIGNNYKRKLVRFRNATKLYGIVLTEKTRLSDQYFPFVQKFVVLELGMSLFPVANQAEASGFLIQWVLEESNEHYRNSFLCKSCCSVVEPVILVLVQKIPGVGKVKALALLQQFPSIQQLSNARTEELEAIVGQTTAQQIKIFFMKI
ncbi:Fanconi anemia core complex-associated protein 24 [Polypterus senegalus]|uniref:Fanconi anemia core complex-associated protein 24 n=1 Tax=Polypterus senegalus TaxID=55291 RepID=UPI0019624D9E|nr:Fanconi anemia core complex-associated protein 24 [Polypterus senegalus]